MRHSRAFLALVVAVSGVGLAVLPTAASGAALDEPCADVEVIVARGSGQALGESIEMSTFVDQLSTHLNGAVSMNVYELGTEAHGGDQYPAVNVSEFWNGNIFGAFFSGGQAFDYGESVHEGVRELITYGMGRGFDCPDSRFVLAGYSQGAQVVGQTLDNLSTLEEQTDFVAFFGDPKLYLPEGEGFRPPACRGEEYSPWRRDVPDCRTDNGSLGARKPYLPVGFLNKTGLWCNNDDMICGSSKWGKTGGHFQYADPGNAAEKAAEEAAERLAVSLGSEVAEHFVWDIGRGNGTAGLDVVFVLDPTGSLSGRIALARQFANEMADAVHAANGRVALVTYRDRGDAYTARVDSPLTDDVAAFASALSVQRASGGGDAPEAMLHALMTAFNNLEWKAGATKAAVVLTDAGWHDPDRVDGTTLESMAARSLEIDPVNVYPVVPQYMALQYEPVAQATSGKVIVDGGNTAEALMEALTQIAARPVAWLRNAEYVAEVGQQVTFDASDSAGSGSPIAHYDWDFDGDSSFELRTTEPVARHVYDEVFDGYVQVRVTAEDGGIGSHSVPVRIGQPEPVRLAAPSVTVTAGSGSAGEVTLAWTPDAGADSWLVAVNDVPIGLTRDNPVVITDIDRAADVTFSVTPISTDGEPGLTGTGVLAVDTTATAATVHSVASLRLTNAFSTVGEEGHVTTAGDFACDSSVHISGDVTAVGNAHLTNDCTIDGALRVGGTVRMDSRATVGGMVTAVGDVSIQASSRIGGDVVSGGSVRSLEGLGHAALLARGTVGGTITEAAVVSGPDPADLGTVADDPLVGATPTPWQTWLADLATANAAPAWSSALAPTPSCTMAAGAYSINGRHVPVTQDTVIDARTATTGCTAVSFQGVQLRLGADLTVVADSLRTVGDVSFVSVDGEPHRVRLVTPAGATGSVVTLARGLAVDPQVEVEVVTAGTATIGGPSAFTGSVTAGLVRTNGQVAITAPRAR